MKRPSSLFLLWIVLTISFSIPVTEDDRQIQPGNKGATIIPIQDNKGENSVIILQKNETHANDSGGGQNKTNSGATKSETIANENDGLVTSDARPDTKVSHNKTTKAKYIPTAVLKQCALIPENDTVLAKRIDKVLKNEATLIEFKVKFRGQDWPPSTISGKQDSLMFKPFFWVRTTGRFGTRLLLLKPNYDIMSLKSLELEASKFKRIYLNEYPPKCMNKLGYDDFEKILRELVMNNFQNTSLDLFNSSETDNVCNLHIRDIHGSDFTYFCCHREKDAKMTCDYLKSDVWLDMMHFAIIIIKLLFILYCPLLIPNRFLRKITDENCFRYRLKSAERINIRLVKEGSTSVQDDKSATTHLKLSKIKHMTKFKSVVQSLPLNGQSKTYEITHADLHAADNELIDPGKAPASIFKLLKDYVLKCNVRELSSTKDCCNSLLCQISRSKVTWYHFARIVMRVVTGLFLLAPWALRMFIYYRYEHKEISMRKSAAAEKGYYFHFPGNFVWYLTPLHSLFIFVYILLLLEAIFFRNISKKTQEEFKFLFKKCYEDMQAASRTKAFGVFINILLLPFEKFGCLGILIALFLWILLVPVALVYLVFHMFPTVNLTIRMLVHFIVYSLPQRATKRSQNSESPLDEGEHGIKAGIRLIAGRVSIREEHNKCLGNIQRQDEVFQDMRSLVNDITVNKERKYLGSINGRLMQLVVILVCLVTTYSTIFVLFEMATFFLDVFIYTLIGFILYADHTMSYISLAVLLVVYAKDCFGSVSKRYRKYSSILNRYIMTLCYKDALPDFYQSIKDQVNKAFVVNPCSLEEDPCKQSGRDWPEPGTVSLGLDTHSFAWKVKNVAFFLTRDDQPKIPTKLFFKACLMTYANAPGRLLHQYLRALLSFMYIVAFLLFVFLVVMTFGESGTLSAANQLLATVAGGVLPFLLKKFLFRPIKEETIEPDTDINFRVAVHDLIHAYEQKWSAFDIDAAEMKTDTSYLNDEVKHTDVRIEKSDGEDNDIPELRHMDLEGSNNTHAHSEYVTQIAFEYNPAFVDRYEFEILHQRLKVQNSGNREEILKNSEVEDENLPLNSTADNV